MPSAEELEQMLERDLSEFPDDAAWEELKAEIMSQRGDPDGEDARRPRGDG